MASPAHSGNPGTPFLLFFACVCVFMIVKLASRIREVRREKAVRQDPRVASLPGILFIVILFLIAALWSIWANHLAPP